MTPLYKTKPFHKKYFIITKKQRKKENPINLPSACLPRTSKCWNQQ